MFIRITFSAFLTSISIISVTLFANGSAIKIGRHTHLHCFQLFHVLLLEPYRLGQQWDRYSCSQVAFTRHVINRCIPAQVVNH